MRAALHVAGGMLWALVVGEIAVFALHAGPVGELILAMDVAFAIACLFFSAPAYQTLSIVGSTAAAAPLVALGCRGPTRRPWAPRAPPSPWPWPCAWW